MPKGRVDISSCQKECGIGKNDTNGVFRAVLCRFRSAPRTRGGAAPRPPVVVDISHGKCDQLMRPRATAVGMSVCVSEEALGVGVGHEAILVDA